MNKIVYSLLLFVVVLLTACGGSEASKTNKPSAKTSNTTTQASAERNVIYDNPQEVSYTPEESKIMGRLNELLGQSSKCEYVFYLPGYSMSTEIADPNQLRNFIYFVSAKEPVRTDCDMEVGMAIRNIESDEIHVTIDAVVTKKDCAFASVTFDGKTHKMSMTAMGIKHVMQFLNIKPSDGTPIAK